MASSASGGVLGRLRGELASVERDRRALEAELEVLRRYEQGLLAARDDMMGVVPKRQRASRGPKNRKPSDERGTRTQAITDILRASRNPLPINNLIDALAERGMPDKKRSVYATLSYLRRQGVAEPVKRGTWQAIAA